MSTKNYHLAEVYRSQNGLEPKQVITSTTHQENSIDSNDSFSVLGLKSSLKDEDFSHTSSGIEHHLKKSDWILVFLENNYDAIDDDSLRYSLSEELLDKIGFERDSNAVKTMLSRSKLLRNDVDPIDIVKRYVVDEFKYNPVLANGCDLAKEEVRVQEQKPELKIVHVDTTDAVMDKRETYSVDDDICDDDVVLFHGTDIKSAFDISFGGIDVCTGSQKRDFSDGSGFYLTDKFENAKNWALSITQKPAILIFTIPKHFLKKANILNLSSEMQWKEIVDANRSGILDRDMRKTLKEYDGIEGPCTGLSETDNLVDSRQPLPNTYQLCITNEDFADKISGYLSKIVVYDRI
ncbi:uncharacterized protein LOC110253134 [Exaiptasia diaphana]|uniref:Uncharacterized protein n=1 Tax=Exaiptasia diaphana TaxID=2652724 RepID=A0A913Y6V8_EXADI|nr:uncharacterized protein LOC110253134 [Exaiptasia diaphana]